jgi:transcriptional regulator with XRE-family HTH domain
MVDVGSRIKQLRTAKELSQTELGKRLGLSKGVISAYEMGSRNPSYGVLIKIAAFFAVTTDFLLGVEANHGIAFSGLSESNAKLVMSLIYALQEKQ